jgi:hypothetical protein
LITLNLTDLSATPNAADLPSQTAERGASALATVGTTVRQPLLFAVYAVHCFYGCREVARDLDPEGASARMEAHYRQAHASLLTRPGWEPPRPLADTASTM